jgi:carbon monoxide dehydrogenase subunit G
LAVIKLSRDIMATPDSVWEVVADLDNEPEIWHGTKSIKNISKNGNTIERNVVIAFRNSVCKEIVQLDPKKTIKTEILSGPVTGTKTLTLRSIDGDKTRIEVHWDIQVSGLYKLFTGMVKKHIHRGTEDALERISKRVTEEQ